MYPWTVSVPINNQDSKGEPLYNNYLCHTIEELHETMKQFPNGKVSYNMGNEFSHISLEED